MNPAMTATSAPTVAKEREGANVRVRHPSELGTRAIELG
jgi:hypothetical protein